MRSFLDLRQSFENWVRIFSEFELLDSADPDS